MYAIRESVSSFPAMDKALLFKMATNQEDQLNSLLSYYRDRMNDFDKDRSEWLTRLNEIVTTEAEKHKLHWDLQRRKDEVASLKESLDKFRSNLYTERQNVLAVSRENELLRLKDLEDQKKLAGLGALVEPVQENIILAKNQKPQVNYQYSRVDPNIHRNKANFENVLKKVGRDGLVEGHAKCVIKTISLPNEGINSLEQQNDELREEIAREREEWLEKIANLQNEIKLKEDRIADRNSEDASKIATLHKTAQDLEKQHVDLTKELFQLKIATNERERKLHEENELLRLKNTAIANKLLIIEKKANIDTKKVLDEAEKISFNTTSNLRNQVRTKDDNIQILKDQYNQVQKIYLNKMKQLEEDMTKIHAKYEKLEQKRSLGLAGYKSTIRLINSRIQNIQREIANQEALLHQQQYENDQEQEHEDPEDQY